jgi:hypothetical protein
MAVVKQKIVLRLHFLQCTSYRINRAATSSGSPFQHLCGHSQCSKTLSSVFVKLRAPSTAAVFRVSTYEVEDEVAGVAVLKITIASAHCGCAQQHFAFYSTEASGRRLRPEMTWII